MAGPQWRRPRCPQGEEIWNGCDRLGCFGECMSCIKERQNCIEGQPDGGCCPGTACWVNPLHPDNLPSCMPLAVFDAGS